MLNEQFIRSSMIMQELHFFEDETLYLQRFEKLLIFETDTLASKVCIFYDVSNLIKKAQKR